MTLAELESGKTAVVECLNFKHHEQELGKRLAAMGIIPSKQITVIRKALLWWSITHSRRVYD